MNLPSLISEVYLVEMADYASRTPLGAFVEVGVFQGGSAQRLHAVARAQGRQLHLFDTFTGIPFQGPLDGHAVGEMMAGPEALARIRAAMPDAYIHVGVFPDTIPRIARGVQLRSIDLTAAGVAPSYTAEDVIRSLGQPISFVHADADQHQSTKDICEVLFPLLTPRGMILFDDYGGPSTRGCTAAVNEYVAKLEPAVGRLIVSGHGRRYLVKGA